MRAAFTFDTGAYIGYGAGTGLIATMLASAPYRIPNLDISATLVYTNKQIAGPVRAPGGPQALAELCAHYWRPLYAFARRRGHTPEDAQDLVQGFFEHLIGRDGLSAVDRAKGRFRSFLLASFQNFMAAEHRRAHRQKRGGAAERLRLVLNPSLGRSLVTRRGLRPRRARRRAQMQWRPPV